MIGLEERICGLSLLWKEAEYNFAYWDELGDFSWDDAYREYLPRVMAETDLYGYYRTLQEFISLLRDGHTYVVMPEGLEPPYDVPIYTSYADGSHILTGVPRRSGLPLFSKLLAVNGEEVRRTTGSCALKKASNARCLKGESRPIPRPVSVWNGQDAAAPGLI